MIFRSYLPQPLGRDVLTQGEGDARHTGYRQLRALPFTFILCID
jgi:hypothetical protein